MLALAVTTLVIGGGTAMSAESANAALPPVVTFQNLATGFVLDSNPWGDVYTLTGNGGRYQKWVVTPSDYGTVTLRNDATWRCLDSNTNGDVYTLWCNGGSFQKWIVLNRSFGTVVLRNLATGLVVDSNPSGDVYALPENGGSYQKWFPIRPDAGSRMTICGARPASGPALTWARGRQLRSASSGARRSHRGSCRSVAIGPTDALAPRPVRPDR